MSRGTKSKYLEAKYDTPSLWSPVGGLEDIVSTIDSQTMSPPLSEYQVKY